MKSGWNVTFRPLFLSMDVSDIANTVSVSVSYEQTLQGGSLALRLFCVAIVAFQWRRYAVTDLSFWRRNVVFVAFFVFKTFLIGFYLSLFCLNILTYTDVAPSSLYT